MMRRLLTPTIGVIFTGVIIIAAYLVFRGPKIDGSYSHSLSRVINISSLKPGDIMKIQMMYPIWILHRNNEMIERLKETSGLADPTSTLSIQPQDAKNIFRSINPEYFVFIPAFDWTARYSGWHGYIGIQEIDIKHNGHERWAFIDSAQKDLKFDYSGRIARYEDFDWLLEANNLVVPDYEYMDSENIKIDLSNLHLLSDPFK